MEVKKKQKTLEKQVGQQLFLHRRFFIHLLMHLFGDFKRTSSHPSFKNPFDLFRQTCVHTTEKSNEKSSLLNQLFLLKLVSHNHQTIALHTPRAPFQNIQNVSKQQQGSFSTFKVDFLPSNTPDVVQQCYNSSTSVYLSQFNQEMQEVLITHLAEAEDPGTAHK